MLEVGTVAPDFTLPDQDGNQVSLKSFRGQKVVLYFYPKDNTPGCSKDSVASHKKFQEKYNLPFTLLSDTELKVLQAYDVWQEKNMYGKKTMGVVRSTYLIDEKGVIVKAFGKVKAAENPQQMLEVL